MTTYAFIDNSRFLVCGLLGALLIGCGSSAVKLDEPTRTARPVQEVTTEYADGTNSQHTVTPVTASTADTNTANALSERSIYFGFDQFSVDENYLPLLKAHAQNLSENPNQTIVIEGNTDSRGSREYNLALGQKRANAVRASLERFGVNSARIEAISFGEERPRRAEKSEDAYSENRRADLVYPGEAGSAPPRGLGSQGMR